MLTYPDIDPIAISLGTHTVFGKTITLPDVHWYGVMYLFGFAAAWGLGMYRAGMPHTALKRSQVEDMVFYAAIGLVVGARIGYVFFYNVGEFIADPAWLFRVWEGGMSFHGGALGVLVAMFFYARKIKVNYVDLMDFLVPLAPLGLCFGRLGNFIGQELWGRETTAAIGMIFPKDPEHLVRHPSQLYQAGLEGIALFIILFWFSRKPRPRGAIVGLGALMYGVFRFFVEFFRQPDAQIGFDLFGFFSRGQELSFPMIVGGAFILFWVYRQQGQSKK